VRAAGLWQFAAQQWAATVHARCCSKAGCNRIGADRTRVCGSLGGILTRSAESRVAGRGTSGAWRQSVDTDAGRVLQGAVQPWSTTRAQTHSSDGFHKACLMGRDCLVCGGCAVDALGVPTLAAARLQPCRPLLSLPCRGMVRALYKFLYASSWSKEGDLKDLMIHCVQDGKIDGATVPW
jgi:hypothetical protein